MKISAADVEYVANLARLELVDGEEKEHFAEQLSKIFDYVEVLNQVDTTDVPPTILAVDLDNIFRTDEVQTSLTNEDALANAPDKKDGFFRVPTII